MAAPAVATPRRAKPTRPQRRTTAARRATTTRNVIRLPVQAVGRTAGAVGDLADSGVVVGMARGRAWIAILSVLLGGIVAINVAGLSLSTSGSKTAAKIDALKRENSVLRGRAANRLSNDKVSAAAARLGLAVPPADAVGYLKSGRKDIEEAARRIAAGEIALAPPIAAETIEAESEETVDPLVSEAGEVVEPVAPEAGTTVATAEPAQVP